MSTTRCAGAAAGLFLLPALLFCQPADSPWPMFRHDARNTGRSPHAGPARYALKWSYAAAGFLSNSSPCVGPRGEIYAGSSDNNLCSLDPLGALRWSYATGGGIVNGSAPAVDAGGDIFIGSHDYRVYSFSSPGAMRWSYLTGHYVSSAPAIDGAGTVYAGSWDNTLYALTPSGSLRWSYSVAGSVRCPPAIDSGNRLFFSTNLGGPIYSLNSDASLFWSYWTSQTWPCPALGTDGRMYLGSYNNRMYALNSNGSLSWSYRVDGYIKSPAAVSPDGSVSFSSRDARIYSLTSNGALRWSYMTASGTLINASAPSADEHGRVYVAALDDRLYCLDSGGALVWSYASASGISGYSSPAIDSDGTLYIGMGGDTLLAIQGNVPTVTPAPTGTPAPTLTPAPTQTPPPTATPDCGVVLVPSGEAFAPGDPFTLGIRVSISVWARFDAYLFAVTPAGTYTVTLDGTVLPGIVPVARGVPRLDSPFRMTVLEGFPLPESIEGTTTLYLVTVHAGHIPPVSDPSELTMNTHYVITVDRKVIVVSQT